MASTSQDVALLEYNAYEQSPSVLDLNAPPADSPPATPKMAATNQDMADSERNAHDQTPSSIGRPPSYKTEAPCRPIFGLTSDTFYRVLKIEVMVLCFVINIG